MKVGETKVEFLFFSRQILSLVCVTLTLAEPPSSSYGPPPPPSSSYGPPGIGLSTGQGSGYQAVGSGYQESEGANLDPQLLHKIEEILLDEENQKSSRTSSILFNVDYEHMITTNRNLFCPHFRWIQRRIVQLIRATFIKLWPTACRTSRTRCWYVHR